jgi:hypothetical protein
VGLSRTEIEKINREFKISPKPVQESIFDPALHRRLFGTFSMQAHECGTMAAVNGLCWEVGAPAAEMLARLICRHMNQRNFGYHDAAALDKVLTMHEISADFTTWTLGEETLLQFAMLK